MHGRQGQYQQQQQFAAGSGPGMRGLPGGPHHHQRANSFGGGGAMQQAYNQGGGGGGGGWQYQRQNLGRPMLNWTSKECAAFVNSLGYGKYAAMFEQEDIDGGILSALTLEMMVGDIGILAQDAGPILKAITAYQGNSNNNQFNNNQFNNNNNQNNMQNANNLGAMPQMHKQRSSSFAFGDGQQPGNNNNQFNNIIQGNLNQFNNNAAAPALPPRPVKLHQPLTANAINEKAGVQKLGGFMLQSEAGTVRFPMAPPDTWQSKEVFNWAMVSGLREIAAEMKEKGITGLQLLGMNDMTLTELGFVEEATRKRILRQCGILGGKDRSRKMEAPVLPKKDEANAANPTPAPPAVAAGAAAVAGGPSSVAVTTTPAPLAFDGKTGGMQGKKPPPGKITAKPTIHKQRSNSADFQQPAHTLPLAMGGPPGSAPPGRDSATSTSISGPSSSPGGGFQRHVPNTSFYPTAPTGLPASMPAADRGSILPPPLPTFLAPPVPPGGMPVLYKKRSNSFSQGDPQQQQYQRNSNAGGLGGGFDTPSPRPSFPINVSPPPGLPGGVIPPSQLPTPMYGAPVGGGGGGGVPPPPRPVTVKQRSNSFSMGVGVGNMPPSSTAAAAGTTNRLGPPPLAPAPAPVFSSPPPPPAAAATRPHAGSLMFQTFPSPPPQLPASNNNSGTAFNKHIPPPLPGTATTPAPTGVPVMQKQRSRSFSGVANNCPSSLYGQVPSATTGNQRAVDPLASASSSILLSQNRQLVDLAPLSSLPPPPLPSSARPWQKGFDSTHNREYWFNSITNESTWIEPQEVKAATPLPGGHARHQSINGVVTL